MSLGSLTPTTLLHTPMLRQKGDHQILVDLVPEEMNVLATRPATYVSYDPTTIKCHWLETT